MSTDLRVSVLVEDQFPEFVRDEGPKLVAFIKAYYEWMETNGQVVDASKNILNYQDIDRTVDGFIEYFNREVMTSLPRGVLADKRLLVKNIQDFYKARGTENAYSLLFRILYDEEIELYYPGQEILRASDGRWQFENVLRITEPTNGSVFSLGGQSITGLTSGAIAKVDKVLSTLKNGSLVFECYISNITGEFVDAELIRNTDSTITGAVVSESGKIKRVIVDQFSAGSGHVSGDKIRFVSASGTGANGQVVGVSNTGSVLTVSVDNEGSGYNRIDSLTLFNLDRVAANAVGYPITTAIISNPGKYTDTKGFVSWNNKIQDSKYYQEFSYVIRSENVITKYREFVSNLLHPSGNKMFGEVSVQLEADVSISTVKEYVYTSLSEVDNTYISAAIEPEYVEVFESNVFEIQSPIPTTDNTEYVIILEPISDAISDLDINVEYINDVEFVHTNEIELPALNTIATVKDITVADGDAYAWSNGIETLVPGANITFNDVVYTNLATLGEVNVGYSFLLSESINPRTREFISFYTIYDYQANTILLLANTSPSDVVTIEQFGLLELDIKIFDTFPGVYSTTIVSNTAVMISTIDPVSFTSVISYPISNTTISVYSSEPISMYSNYILNDTIRFGGITVGPP